MKKLPRSTVRRSPCPVAVTLDVIGDKWTLLIIRDIGLRGRHRNKDMQSSPEGIPSNILASRLQNLQELGLVTKRPYQHKPPRYEYFLSPAGEDLLPIVRSMAQWSLKHVRGVSLPADTKAALDTAQPP